MTVLAPYQVGNHCYRLRTYIKIVQNIYADDLSQISQIVNNFTF